MGSAGTHYSGFVYVYVYTPAIRPCIPAVLRRPLRSRRPPESQDEQTTLEGSCTPLQRENPTERLSQPFEHSDFLCSPFPRGRQRSGSPEMVAAMDVTISGKTSDRHARPHLPYMGQFEIT